MLNKHDGAPKSLTALTCKHPDTPGPPAAKPFGDSEAALARLRDEPPLVERT